MAIAPITLSDLSSGGAGFYFWGPFTYDYMGKSVASAGDINGDGYEDIIVGTPGRDGPGGSSPGNPGLTPGAGAAWVILGGPTQLSGYFPASLSVVGLYGSWGIPLDGQSLGWDVASAGDFNGDGYDDVVVSFPSFTLDGGRTRPGASYLVLGSSDPETLFGISRASATGAYTYILGQGSDFSGLSVAGAGDVNGDGFDDLIIGAPKGGSSGTVAGGGLTYVVFGHSGTTPPTINLSEITAGDGGFVIRGRDAFDYTGSSVASAGDINGDGIADILISAPDGDGDGNAQSDAGEAYVVFGRTEDFGTGIDLSTVATGTGGFAIYAEDGADGTGLEVSGAGDVNGDGLADIIISSRLAADPLPGAFPAVLSQAYVVFGQSGGFGPSIDLSAIAAGNGGFRLREAEVPESAAHWALQYSIPLVSALGDVNGDGIDDFSFSGFDNYVIFGRADGFGASLDLTEIAAGIGGFRVPSSLNIADQKGVGGVDFANGGVAGAGDIDGDGYDDIVVGDPYAPNGDAAAAGVNDVGAVYVIYGRDFTGSVTRAGTAGNNALIGTTGADDMVGGQGNDTLIGVGGADVLIGGSGNDGLEVGDATFVRVDGGTGTDTLRITEDVALDLTAIPDTRLKDIEVISLSSRHASLTLSQREVLNISSTTNTLTVNGTSTFGVSTNIIRFDYWNWTETGPSGGYDIYTKGAATLKVDSDIEVVGFLEGTDGDDAIDAGALDDTLSGLGGNDTLNGFAGNDTLNGGDGNDTLVGGSGNDSMKGSADNDIYSVDSVGDTVIENANQGTDRVETTLNSYTLGSNVENLTFVGTGAFTGTGNTLANTITGGAGNDTLDGRSGNDTLVGGTGDDSMTGGGGSDTYSVDAAGDTVIEKANEGTDTVNTTLNSYTLGDNVENLTFVGTGDFVGTGNALANTITGGAGDDVLDGRGGADVMNGGIGNDTFYVDAAGDQVKEAPGGGTDTVYAAVDWTVTAGQEIETLRADGAALTSGVSLTTNGSGTYLIGGAGIDHLTGGGGRDRLDGKGSADVMAGGGNDDVYFVDASGDQVIENLDEGADRVETTLNSYTLGDNVETLTFVGTGNFAGTGNALMNTIIGGTGDDVLDGRGGDDVMDGGTGNDIFHVDNASDQVKEASGGGTDTVYAAVDWTATAGQEIETLRADGAALASGVSLTANGFGTYLIGGAGIDHLTGGGGKDRLDGQGGADVMAGGGNDDIYYVDAAGDQVIEKANEGTDRVEATLNSYTLSGNVETLIFVGTGTFAGIGNAVANTITGGAGKDRLDGRGGVDVMAGGGDNDLYYVDAFGDQVMEGSGGGSDTVYASTTWTIAADKEIEALRAYGAGALSGVSLTANDLGVRLFGGSGIDHLTGGAGIDRLDGQGGADVMAGGGDNDLYYVDAFGDQVMEGSGGGSDTVYASATWTMAADQEIETLRAFGAGALSGVSLTANDLGVRLLGGSGADHLTGGDGIDRLDGQGGADVMAGGADDDLYYVDAFGDQMMEGSGGGSDTVYASTTWTMTADQEIETLRAFGAGALSGVALTANDLGVRLFGGAGVDHLTGGAGIDRLNGQGGADVMAGGGDDDLYYVDAFGDQVTEGSGGGSDTVYASTTWTMTVDQEIETLRAYGDALVSGVSLTANGFGTYLIGGAGVDHLTGGAGKDRLDGKGGVDVMAGGGDNDLYYVDAFGDQVIDGSDGGSDTVYASTTWTMAADQEIEILRASGAGAMSGVSLTANDLGVRLFGGSGVDQLTGGAGIDRLDGRGGSDVMAGGGDDDIYYVDSGDDKVMEGAGGGIDTVYASVDYTLTTGQEIETLRGSGVAGLVLGGNELDNVLIGGSGGDMLNGGEGNDQITGGAGADIIRASFGRDIVTDFKPGTDRLDVGFFQFLDFVSVMAAATDVGKSVVFALYDDTTITLNGVQKSQLQTADIIL